MSADAEKKEEQVRQLRTRLTEALRRDGLEPGRVDVAGLSDGHCRFSVELRVPELSGGLVPTPVLNSRNLLDEMALIFADVLDYRIIPGNLAAGRFAKALRDATRRRAEELEACSGPESK